MNSEEAKFILLAWRGHEFPVFNVADVCVTAGVILFALVWTHDPEPQAAGAPEDASGPTVGSGGAGHGSGSPLGPVAGEGSNRGPVA